MKVALQRGPSPLWFFWSAAVAFALRAARVGTLVRVHRDARRRLFDRVAAQRSRHEISGCMGERGMGLAICCRGFV